MGADALRWDNTRRALEEFGKRLVDKYREELKARNKSATGKLAKTAKYVVKSGHTYIFVALNLEDYWKYVEYGREKGKKFPPLNAIAKWIDAKPVIPRPDKNGRLPTTRQLSFLIARKIATKGIRPTNIFEKSVEAVYEQMDEALEAAITADIGEYVTRTLVYGSSI